MEIFVPTSPVFLRFTKCYFEAWIQTSKRVSRVSVLLSIIGFSAPFYWSIGVVPEFQVHIEFVQNMGLRTSSPNKFRGDTELFPKYYQATQWAVTDSCSRLILGRFQCCSRGEKKRWVTSITKSSEKAKKRKTLSMRAPASVFSSFQFSEMLTDVTLAEVAEALPNLKLSHSESLR